MVVLLLMVVAPSGRRPSLPVGRLSCEDVPRTLRDGGCVAGIPVLVEFPDLESPALKGKVARGVLKPRVVVEVAGDLTDGISAMVKPAESASKAFDEQTTAVDNLEQNISPLLGRYDELMEKSVLNKEEQAELKKIVELS